MFGWGPGELGGLPYWGDALAQFSAAFATYEAKCGPISSFHDRACELFAQIKGTRVDYGEAHSLAAGHARWFRDYARRGFVSDWSEENPIILVGHSAGAQTCLQLQRLLAQDFWGLDTNANWIKAIVSVAGVLNGSTLAYQFACDKRSGKLVGTPNSLIGFALSFVRKANIDANENYDLFLDQWTRKTYPTNDDLMRDFDNGAFLDGEDNLAFDLTLQGCYKANQLFSTNTDTYYLSIVTSKTSPTWISRLPFAPKRYYPDSSINLILLGPALYQGVAVAFDQPPIPGWDAGNLTIDAWRENDGAVSSISQRYPFTAGLHPVGGEGLFARVSAIEKGKWYFERAEQIVQRRFDHFGVVVGAKLAKLDPEVEDAQKLLYRNISSLLTELRE